MRADDKDFVEKLQSLAHIDSQEVVAQELESVRPEDIAEGLQRLEPEEALSLLRLLDDTLAAEVLVELPTENARRLARELPDSVLAHFLDILPMDDALDLQEELGAERFEALLSLIPFEDAQEIRRLARYPEDSVGRVMTERFFEVAPDMTVNDMLADLRRATEEKYETINDLYVLDEGRHLLGVFSLRKAIRANPKTTARELMRLDVVSVRASDGQEEAARTMSRYGFYALPVLDEDGRMVGVFTGDDAQDILREAETEDVLKLGAVSGTVEAYLSLSVWQLVKRRLPWLFILFIAETFTGAVLRFYVHRSEGLATETGQIDMVARLMIFVPLLIGAGGNSGSQVTTTITRALAVGELKSSDVLLVWTRELATAIVIGTVLGATSFFRAMFGWNSGLDVSLTVGLTLIAIVVWAATIGSVLPLAAKRLGVDPAVMSAPFITTFVDATGLVIYFEIARRTLGLTF
jgi:magnesium transporter